jgi:hypothetical protein
MQGSFNETLPAATDQHVQMWAPPRRSTIIEMHQVVVNATEYDRSAYLASRDLIAQAIFQLTPLEAPQEPQVK